MTPSEMQNGLAVALRATRQRKGLSLRAVERRSGIYNMARIESGEHAINVRTLVRLAVVLECLPSDLFREAEGSQQLEIPF
jgi:transcriptional regulator with XRE-family HTH domain